MDIDLSEAYEAIARQLRSNPEDLHAAVGAGGKCLFPDDPDWGYTELWDDVFERLEELASVDWQEEMSEGRGSVSISLLPLTPDSVWLLRHVFFDENTFESIQEFPNPAAAREGVSEAFVNLLADCGLPDMVFLPKGFGVSRFRKIADARLARGNRDLYPWTFDDVSKTLRSITIDLLPHKTGTEKQALLDRYIENRCRE